jgi:ribulose-5-phosphate 4-epimerase/fuculose-1-phosphate aldolase
MDEKSLRLEVATCCRLAEYLGFFDFSGHISARIPGTDTILINSRDTTRSSIGPQDIVKANLKGESLKKGSEPPSEVYIHTAVYERRPDVFAVAHLHSRSLSVLSAAGKTFVPVTYRASIFGRGVTVLDDCRAVTSAERGRVLAEKLGEGRALIMRSHGSVVAAESVKALFYTSVYLEENARNLITIYQMGEPWTLREEEIAEGSGDWFWKPRLFDKVWYYYADKAGIKLHKAKKRGGR